MKLEVGKFYTVRNNSLSGIIKVRIDAIVPDRVVSQQVSASVFRPAGSITASSYCLSGRWVSDDTEDANDLVANFDLPRLIFTASDVGRVVELSNGRTELIIAFNPKLLMPVESSNYFFDLEGKSSLEGVHIVRRLPK